MSELNIEQECPAFEAAYRAKWPTICAVNHRKFERDEDNEYIDYTVQVALEMWLAAKRTSMESTELSATYEFDINQKKQEFETWYANRNIIKKSPVSEFIKTKSGDYTHSYMRSEFDNWLLSKNNSPPSTDAKDAERLLQEIMACTRYDPARGKSNAGKWTTINARTELIERIDAAIAAKKPTP